MDEIPELLKYPKFFDVSQLYSQAAGSGITLCNNINAGTEVNNRVGRKIRMRALRFHLFMGPEATAVMNYNLIRIMVIYDNQTNGNTTPTFTDIMGSVQGFETSSYRQRFRILKDWFYQVPRFDISLPAAGTSNTFLTESFVSMDEYIPLDLETVYNGTGGAQISTGSLLIYTVGSNATTPYAVTIRLNARLYFQDE